MALTTGRLYSARNADWRGLMGLWIVLGLVVVLVIWAIGLYNRLVGLRNQTTNGWRQIDVQLTRRHDLIPNLVATVKGAMEFEQNTLTAVMEARSRAMAATGPAEAGKREGELTQALGRLFAVAENYPQLRATENVKMLQEELAGAPWQGQLPLFCVRQLLPGPARSPECAVSAPAIAPAPP